MVTAALTLALIVAMQTAPDAVAPDAAAVDAAAPDAAAVDAAVPDAAVPDAAVPALEPLAPENPSEAPEAPPAASGAPDAPPEMPTVTGTTGGLLGAASGCALGTGLPALVGGVGGGVLYWLYSGAAAGTILGWTPALAALGTSCGIGLSAVGLPLFGSSAAAIGAMIGAKNDGRDPMPALYGALPGIGLAGISTALSCTAMAIGCGGFFAAAQPVVVLGVLAIATGIAAPGCTACGAGIADLAWGNPDVSKPEEPVATPTPADANETKTAMRF